MITLANRPTTVVADNKKMTTMEPHSSKTVMIVMEISVMVPSPQ
jgi:hypothetical protein